MNRRSFLQSLTVAFSAVATGTRLSLKDEPPAIDYSLFTMDEHHLGLWSALVNPFSVDGSVYATDSRVLIRHPGEWSGDDAGRLPDVSKLWWEEFDEPGWHPLGVPVHVSHSRGADCPTCRGKGFVGPESMCLACKGIGGTLDEEGDFYRECPNCNEGVVGLARCPAGCVGGVVKYRERIGSGLFCPDYMARLRTLGDIEVRTIDVAKGTKVYSGGTVLLVRGPREVRGLLCGMMD